MRISNRKNSRRNPKNINQQLTSLNTYDIIKLETKVSSGCILPTALATRKSRLFFQRKEKQCQN